ncbi:MAG: cytochrome c peroxidase [Sedimenticolaceae bacterium]
MLSIKVNRYQLLFYFCVLASSAVAADWTTSELSLLRQQWIGSLPELPPDPGNQVADDPGAAELGHSLFFDKRLSANGKISCANCHLPEKSFTDGLARARGIGEAARSSPSLIGVAFGPWYFWDGRSDSLWSQALGPLESAEEHGGDRLKYARIIAGDPVYRKQYEELFGPLPDLFDRDRFPQGASPVGNTAAVARWNDIAEDDRKAATRVFVNIGKAIAAYERTLIPGPSRFDQYVERLLDGDPTGADLLTADEIAGLRLFIGKAMCVTCHMGPMFTNHGFHNVGAPDPAAKKPKYRLPILHLLAEKPPVDPGRYRGVRRVMESEFNCLGEYSDAEEKDCSELIFANVRHQDTLGAFKVPTLRNVAKTAPYMHAGQFENLGEVLRHYNNPPRAPSGRSELAPLNLTDRERKQLEAFLHSLNSSPAAVAEQPRMSIH